MKRKLFSTMLCALALLLLMGAGVEPGSAAPLAIEEESTVSEVLETETTTDSEAEQAEDAQPVGDPTFLVDGQPVPFETERQLRNGMTWVVMAPTVLAIDPTAQIRWDSATGTATVTTEQMTITAKVGQYYVEANGRYLYVEDGVQRNAEGRVMVPLKVLTRAFDADLSWDGATDTIYVQRGSGAIRSGDEFYNQDDLFWLSRVIFAEAGNQTLKGQMAVGNVVLNRVESDLFPDTIVKVLSQRNQFSTWRGGRLANRVPTESCMIAAKLVMDGGVVEQTRGALFFDSLTYSWASRNKTYVTTLGGHKFYC